MNKYIVNICYDIETMTYNDDGEQIVVLISAVVDIEGKCYAKDFVNKDLSKYQ